MKKYIFVASKSERVLKFLTECLPTYKYSDFAVALSKKDVLVNKNRIKKDEYVLAGDSVEVFLPDQTFGVPIVYEDDDVIVFDKGKKIEVCDGEYNIKNEYQKYFGKEIFAIHRLDAGTGGLVLFAKNRDAEKILTDGFKKHLVKKYYYAVVSGESKQNDTLKGYLVKDAERAKVKIFDKPTFGAFEVELEYQKIAQKDDLKMLNVMIVAGKTHQIRAQLAHAHLPILGDDKYGDREINKKYKYKFQLLQAYKIVFLLENNSRLQYLNNVNLEAKCEFEKMFF